MKRNEMSNATLSYREHRGKGFQGGFPLQGNQRYRWRVIRT